MDHQENSHNTTTTNKAAPPRSLRHRLLDNIRSRKKRYRFKRIQNGLTKFSRRLHLNDPQQAGLAELFSQFETLVKMSKQGRRTGIHQFSVAAQTDTFDVELAQNTVNDNFAAVQIQTNVTLAHFGEWFSTLDQAQRETFRGLVQQRLGIA